MEEIRKIMIVDDSKMDIMLLEHCIKAIQNNVEIKSYEDPWLAIQSIRDSINNNDFSNIPKLIFLDLNMPGINGFAFLDLFISFPRDAIFNCKIIIITSSDEFDSIKKSASYPNVIDFLVKPPHKLESIFKTVFPIS